MDKRAALLTLLASPPRAKTLERPSPPRGEHAREAILACLSGHSGMTLSELRARVPLGWASLYRHVGVLQAQGRLRTLEVGRRRLVTTEDETSPRAHPAAAFLRGSTARLIAEQIAAHPDGRVHEIAAALGVSRRVVYYHAALLVQLGCASRAPVWRIGGLRPTPLLAQLLATVPRGAPEGADAP